MYLAYLELRDIFSCAGRDHLGLPRSRNELLSLLGLRLRASCTSLHKEINANNPRMPQLPSIDTKLLDCGTLRNPRRDSLKISRQLKFVELNRLGETSTLNAGSSRICFYDSTAATGNITTVTVATETISSYERYYPIITARKQNKERLPSHRNVRNFSGSELISLAHKVIPQGWRVCDFRSQDYTLVRTMPPPPSSPQYTVL